MDLDAFLAELAAWSEERDPGFETVSYGDHHDQVVDVRRGGARNAIVVHGGFWRPAFTRANTRALAIELALNGWTTWNVEYRRADSSSAGLADTLADIDAVLDVTGSGVAIGHSAGGHLVLWAAGTRKIDKAVSLAGVSDLGRAAREGIGADAAIEFAGPDPPAHADPMRCLPLTVPALLAHGTEDDRVPFDYSVAYASASGAELLTLPGAGHFEVIDPRTPEWALIAAKL